MIYLVSSSEVQAGEWAEWAEWKKCSVPFLKEVLEEEAGVPVVVAFLAVSLEVSQAVSVLCRGAPLVVSLAPLVAVAEAGVEETPSLVLVCE
jgi:hypothetical protein